MPNNPLLISSYKSLVGFFQFYDPYYNYISKSLINSTSGIYVQGVHPLCNLENIFNCAPEFEKFTYPTYNSSISYSKGAIVRDTAGQLIIATNDIEAGRLDGFEAYDPLSGWLTNVYNSSVIELFNEMIRMKKLEAQNTKTLVDSLKLFDGLGSFADRIIKRGRFVGLQIEVGRQEGLSISIDKIGIQLDTPQTLNLYLYHSSLVDPLKVITLQLTKAGSFEWKDQSNLNISFSSSLNDSNGVFYLGYYEDDLTGQAIKRNSTWRQAPCISCSDWNYKSYQTWSKHIKVNSFSVGSGYINSTKSLWLDASKITSDPTTNWGLNLSLSVNCDLTDFYILNKSLLAYPLAMKICLKILKEIAYSTRINGIAEQTKALSMADLSDKDKDSFYNQYLNELKAVSLDFSGLSSDCMPCTKKQGISYSSI